MVLLWEPSLWLIRSTVKKVSQVFGPAFSVCVLTLFYALLIKALWYAAEARIQFKIINLAT